MKNLATKKPPQEMSQNEIVEQQLKFISSLSHMMAKDNGVIIRSQKKFLDSRRNTSQGQRQYKERPKTQSKVKEFLRNKLEKPKN